MENKKTNLKLFIFLLIAVSALIFPTSAYAQTEGCPSDMIHYWKMDEPTGPTYSDFYGGNDATCTTNCPEAVTGIVSGAQQFAITSQVNVADVNTFDWGVSSSFSIEFWMKTDPSSTCSGNQVVIGRDDPSTPLHWWVGCKDGGQAAFYLGDNSGAGSYLTGVTDLTDGNWHHIAATRNALTNELSLYVDGVKEASTTQTFSNFDSTAAINIGWLNLSSGYHFIGTVDELAVYNKPLSEIEIQQHYQGTEYCTSIITHTITATAGTGGSISPSGAVTVNYGSDQSFTITPDTGYHVANVLVDGFSVGAITTYTFTNVAANHTIEASFAENTYTLTVEKSGTGSGTVNVTDCTLNWNGNVGTCTANSGMNITLSAAADTGSTFSGWSGGTGSATSCSGTGSCSFNITQNSGITAAFSVGTVNGACGSSNGQTLTAMPTTDLCSAGTPTAVNTGPWQWTWSCNGSNGGTTANCSAYIAGNAFIGGVTTPSRVKAGGRYMISCDYGQRMDCIYPIPGQPGSRCFLRGFSGTAALFQCIAGSLTGTFNNACGLFTGTPKNCPARNGDPAGSVTVQ